MTSQVARAGDNRRLAPRFFTKAAQTSALGFATLLFCVTLFRAAVDPSLLRCSTWLVPVAQGAWAPAWMLAPMMALWAVSMCFGAVRWGWFARLGARGARRARARGEYVLTVDVGWPLIVIVAASALLCATPILVAIGSCWLAR